MNSTNVLRLPQVWSRPLLALGAVLLGILLLYGETVLAMAGIWARSDTYAHGFVVPLISLWLVWRVRASVAPLVPTPSPLAWLMMLGAAALWLAGDLVAVNAATQLALVMLLVLAVPAVLGWRVAKALAFPLGFLFFAVPLGDFMLPRLMEWTAEFTVLAIRASGIPVYREGLYFVIPSGSWSVVEACSGIRYLIASVTVGSLFAYLSYERLGKRLVFVGVSILVPLLANWLRAYMIVMIGHFSGNELATGVDHLIYGWVFFGVVIFLMLLIGMRWADAPAAAPAAAVLASGASGPAPRGVVTAALVALCVVVAPHLVERLVSMATRTDAVQLVAPSAVAPWQSVGVGSNGWAPVFENPSATQHLAFAGPQGERVDLRVSYYRQQDYRRKLVSSQNVLVHSEDPHWARSGTRGATARLNGAALQVASTTVRQRSLQLADHVPRWQVWQFYWVDGRFTASDAVAKLQGAWGRLMGRGDDGAIVLLYAPHPAGVSEDAGRDAASAVLEAFLNTHGAALESALQQTRETP